MYWLGRHLERADGVASIIDAHLHLLGDPWADEALACRSALAVAGVEAPIADPARHDMLRILAVDRSEPRSIAASFGAAREHALRSRDIVSAELWDCLSATRSRTPRKVAPDKVAAFIAWVHERSALAIGMVETTSRRDDAWRFFAIGRSIERAELTARALHLTAPDAKRWETTLRSCGVSESYARTHDAAPTAAEVAALLVGDERCPRSIRFCIDRLEQDLAGLRPLSLPRAVTDAAASARS